MNLDSSLLDLPAAGALASVFGGFDVDEAGEDVPPGHLGSLDSSTTPMCETNMKT